MSPLPIKLQRLYDRLKGSGDVKFEDLLSALAISASPGQEQNLLGSYITRLNRRLRNQGKAVKPGHVKRTYRLVTL